MDTNRDREWTRRKYGRTADEHGFTGMGIVERCLACEADGRNKVFNSRKKAQKAQNREEKNSTAGRSDGAGGIVERWSRESRIYAR
jgi:hypothetical protein